MRVAAIFEMMWHYALGDRSVCGPMAMMQTKGAARYSPSDSRHEPGQSAVGRASDPWRTPQTRHRNWPNLRRQVYGKAQETAIARLEDIPPQPRRWDRLD